MNKITKTTGVALLVSCLLAGCASGSAAAPASSAAASAAASQSAVAGSVENTSSQLSTVMQQDDLFTDRDKEVGFVESDAIAITLSGDSIRCDNSSVTVEGSVATIHAAGTYLISGTLNNGQIIVDAGKEDKLHLVLDGAQITCATSAPLYVRQADKVVVTLQNGSDNRLTNTAEYVAIDDNNIDAVLFSKEDITLNGDGALTISAAYGSGMVSKDDLTIMGGTYTITAAEHGLDGKDNVKISDGSFTIEAGKDGIHSENKDDTTLGFIYIRSGTYSIQAQGDGLDAATTLQIDGGNFTVRSGSGSTGTVSEDISSKGLKSGGDLLVLGGTFDLDCTDDGVHSNGNVRIDAGIFTILSGDDGMHADSNVTINDGTIKIDKSYEGIEGQSLDLNGGDIALVSSDDGLNAAGGKDASALGERPGRGAFNADSNAYIHITGGKLSIVAEGDGIDSNGSLLVSGGETYVSGPSGGGNSSLDYDGSGTITGGVFVAAGANSMAQGFGSDSTQGTILYGLTAAQTGGISLTDSTGKALVTWTPQTQYGLVIISTPELAQGQTYTLTTAGTSQQVQMDTLHFSSGASGGMGGGRGGMGGGKGGGMRPGGMTPPDGTTAPEGMPSPDGTPPDGTPPDGMTPPSAPRGTAASSSGTAQTAQGGQSSQTA